MVKQCNVDGCDRYVCARGLCSMHYQRFMKNGDPGPAGPLQQKGSGYIEPSGYKLVSINGRKVREHVAIAEKILGRKLRNGEQVHHINGDRADNTPGNLVICPNTEYHRLLHLRQKSLAACGNPGWRQCNFCKKYDAPENLIFRKTEVYHRSCRNSYRRKKYADSKAVVSPG